MLIAICDDTPQHIEDLEGRVRVYFSNLADVAEKPEIYTFQSGSELLESFALRKYEILLLDIDMPGITGMELASRIRQIDKNVQIAFVTHMEDQLPYAFRVMASGFVVKPFRQEHIDSVLNDIMALIKVGRIPPLEIKIKGGGNVYVEIQEIMYIESFRHYMQAVCKEDRCFEFSAKMTDLEESLSKYNFVRIHRCYLVNLAHVFIHNEENIRLTSGKQLPVGKSYAEKFKTLYLKYRLGNC